MQQSAAASIICTNIIKRLKMTLIPLLLQVSKSSNSRYLSRTYNACKKNSSMQGQNIQGHDTLPHMQDSKTKLKHWIISTPL
jgi:hypothetical protein